MTEHPQDGPVSVILYTPPDIVEWRPLDAIRELYGMARIVENWDGVQDLTPWTLAVTTVAPPYADIGHRAVCMTSRPPPGPPGVPA